MYLHFFTLFSVYFYNRYVECESEKVALENKLGKLQADQELWQDIFLKNAELESELKREKEHIIQLQASTETTNDSVSQLSKDLSFYKKVAHVSYLDFLDIQSIHNALFFSFDITTETRIKNLIFKCNI